MIYLTLWYSRYSSWIFIIFGSTLCPTGLDGSKANSIPATCGNRPSSFGNMETPFSRARWIVLPSHSIKTIGSGNGIIFFKSPTVKTPAGVIQSLLRVPEFIIAQSAFIDLIKISIIKSITMHNPRKQILV